MVCSMSLDFCWDHLWHKALYILDKGIKYSEIARCKVLRQSTLLLLFELFPKGCILPVLCTSGTKTARCVAAFVDSLDRINQRHVGRMQHFIRLYSY